MTPLSRTVLTHARRMFLLLLLPALLPASALAECTFETATTWMDRHLGIRMHALDPIGKMAIYEKAAQAETQQLAQLRKKLKTQNPPDPQDINALCKTVKRLIAIADDVLAEGNGLSSPLKNPWKQQTPETLFAERERFILVCESEPEACNEEVTSSMDEKLHALNIDMRRGKTSAPDVVDGAWQIYQAYFQLLEKKTGKLFPADRQAHEKAGNNASG